MRLTSMLHPRSHQARRSRRRPLFSIALLLTALTAPLTGAVGCTDLRAYTGRWEGPVVSESAVRQGFADTTRVVPLLLEDVSLNSVRATLTTSDGRFTDATLTRFLRASSDELASMTFESDPLRSYLLFGPLTSEPTAAPALFVLSLFPDDRVQLRVLRGNDLYGIFHLERRDE